MRCYSVWQFKTSLGYIPAVPGLVLTLRKNIRSSDTEMGGTVTTTQTLNCPTSSSTLYDGCSNPISTAEKMFVRYDLYYNTPSNSNSSYLRSSSSIVVLPLRGLKITLGGGGPGQGCTLTVKSSEFSGWVSSNMVTLKHWRRLPLPNGPRGILVTAT